MIRGDGRRHTVADGAGDLACRILSHVARGEKSGLIRGHPVIDDRVSARVHVHEALEKVRVRVLADENEYDDL